MIIDVGHHIPYKHGTGLPPIYKRGRYRPLQSGGWQREEVRSLPLDGMTVDGAVQAIQAAAQDLLEVRLVVEPYDSYGDVMVRSEVCGWRTANEDEIRWVKWQMEQDAMLALRSREAEIEAFRTKYPDMIKGGGCR